MDTAVITPIYNEDKITVFRCLDSIVNQSINCDHYVYIDGKTIRLADGTLAGSYALIDTGFRNLINLLNLTILAASQCTSMVPAQSVGLGTSKGQLLPGYDADIVVLDEQYRPLLTIVEGTIVWNAT